MIKSLKSLDLEENIQKIYTYLSKRKLIIISSFIIGLLAYGYIVTNKLPNYDDVKNLFLLGLGMSLGRWMLELMQVVTVTISSPFLNGIVALGIIAITNCVIVDVLEIKKPILKVLISALMIVFPGQYAIYAFMYTSVPYTIAGLLACLAALAFKNKRYVIGIFTGALMMAIYQTYIGLLAALLFILALKKLTGSDTELKAVIKDGLLSIAYVLVIALVYIVLTYIVFKIVGDGFSAYGAGYVDEQKSILGRFLYTYKVTIEEFTSYEMGIVNTKISMLLHFAAIAILAVLSVMQIFRSDCASKAVVFILLLLVLPIVMNCMAIIFGEAVSAMMNFSFLAFYFAIIILADDMENTAFLIKQAVLYLLLLIVINNVGYANKTAIGMQLNFEQTKAFYTTMLSDIHMTEGYSFDKKIAIIGESYIPNYSSQEEYSGVFSHTVKGTVEALRNVYSRETFMNVYLDIGQGFASEDEKNAIAETEEFERMAGYPDKGAIVCTDEYIIVKLR